jgi:hypothetical protein
VATLGVRSNFCRDDRGFVEVSLKTRVPSEVFSIEAVVLQVSFYPVCLEDGMG